MNGGLQVAPGMALPPDVVTQSLALLAIRRAGKSNAAAVLAELMFAGGLPFVVIDPKGDWWGLRSSKNGQGPGLPIPVFGGLHGDLPLTPQSGALIAELIVTQNLTCILDVSDFESDAARMRFLTDLGHALFRLHKRYPAPRHLFLEEADDFIPQTVRANQARCVGIWTKIVKQGGAFGLGITLISQRSAVVNKDALTQTETLIVLRTTGSQDRAAILEWVKYHDAGRELVDSLPGLADGEAWVISPQWLPRHGQPAVQRIRFHQRSTFDSGATPTMGAAVRVPTTLASIDLAVIAERMAAVTEAAEQTDPEWLHRKITALQDQVRQLTADLEAARHTAAVRVPLPVFADGDLAALAAIADRVAATVATAHATSANLAVALTGQLPQPDVMPRSRPPAGPLPAPHAAAPDGTPPPGQLGKAQRKVLTVLAQHPQGRRKRQVAMLAGYSVTSGGYRNTLSSLRTANLITDGDAGMIQATPWGVDALAGQWEPLPSGPALAAYWIGFVGRDAAPGKILAVLLKAWPAVMGRHKLADATGYSVTSGGFRNALSKLRTLELITGSDTLAADETLARETRQGSR